MRRIRGHIGNGIAGRYQTVRELSGNCMGNRPQGQPYAFIVPVFLTLRSYFSYVRPNRNQIHIRLSQDRLKLSNVILECIFLRSETRMPLPISQVKAMQKYCVAHTSWVAVGHSQHVSSQGIERINTSGEENADAGFSRVVCVGVRLCFDLEGLSQ